jgi:adenylyltransferase/sulfurtransferase
VLTKKEGFKTQIFNFDCDSKNVSINNLHQFKNIQFIDVREFHEEPKVRLDNCIQIPLKELETKINQIQTDKTIIVFCQSGIRSKTAVEILEKHSITNCYSLKEGAEAIIEQIKINV